MWWVFQDGVAHSSFIVSDPISLFHISVYGGELLGKNRSALLWKRHFIGAIASFVLKSSYAENE